MPWKPESLSHHSVSVLALNSLQWSSTGNHSLLTCSSQQQLASSSHKLTLEKCLQILSTTSPSREGIVILPFSLAVRLGRRQVLSSSQLQRTLTDVSAAMFSYGCALRRALNYHRSVRPPVNLNSLTPTKFYLDKSSLLSFSDPAECWIPKVFPSSVVNVLNVLCTCIEMHSRILVLLSAPLLVMQRKAKRMMETGFLLCYAVADTAPVPQFPLSEGRKE